MKEQEFLDYCEDLVEKKVVKDIKNYHAYFQRYNRKQEHTSEKHLRELMDRANASIGIYVGGDEYLYDKYHFKKCGECVYSSADIESNQE